MKFVIDVELPEKLALHYQVTAFRKPEKGELYLSESAQDILHCHSNTLQKRFIVTRIFEYPDIEYPAMARNAIDNVVFLSSTKGVPKDEQWTFTRLILTRQHCNDLHISIPPFTENWKDSKVIKPGREQFDSVGRIIEEANV